MLNVSGLYERIIYVIIARYQRIAYLISAFFLILLGLASRAYAPYLPSLVAEHSGDIIWAMMVYCGIRALLAFRPPHLSLLISIIFCFTIEFSQLYQAAWITAIRETTLGALILGRGFLLVDLFRYTVGIGIAFFIDLLIIKRYIIK